MISFKAKNLTRHDFGITDGKQYETTVIDANGNVSFIDDDGHWNLLYVNQYTVVEDGTE